jgi:predicted RNase H-like nuclease (RuvC/YqgF family)
MKDSSTNKLKALEQRIKELERTIGQKQIQIDYLEKMIDIAKGELNIDIKKNSNTPQSSGSERTKRK